MRGRCFDVVATRWKTRVEWPRDKDAKVEWIGFEANIQWLLYEGWKIFLETNHFTKETKVLFRHEKHVCFAKASYTPGFTIVVYSMTNQSKLWDIRAKIGDHLIAMNDIDRSCLLDILIKDVQPKKIKRNKVIDINNYIETRTEVLNKRRNNHAIHPQN